MQKILTYSELVKLLQQYFKGDLTYREDTGYPALNNFLMVYDSIELKTFLPSNSILHIVENNGEIILISADKPNAQVSKTLDVFEQVVSKVLPTEADILKSLKAAKYQVESNYSSVKGDLFYLPVSDYLKFKNILPSIQKDNEAIRSKTSTLIRKFNKHEAVYLPIVGPNSIDDGRHRLQVMHAIGMQKLPVFKVGF